VPEEEVAKRTGPVHPGTWEKKKRKGRKVFQGKRKRERREGKDLTLFGGKPLRGKGRAEPWGKGKKKCPGGTPEKGG